MPCISAVDLILTEHFNSGLRRLLPKPPASQCAFQLLAPPPPSLQNPQPSDEIGTTENADFAADNAGPFGLAQRGADCIRQASAARKSMGLLIQEYQNIGAKTPIAPSPKIPINRVQKPDKRQARGPKIAVACENCR